jgi:Na+-driven multidrug efflux pump
VLWVFQIPLAYFLAIHLNWGATGVFWAIAISHSLHALVSTLVFRKGKWKLVEV